MDGVIRIICLAITMTAVVLVIDTLKNKRPSAEDAGQTATCYTLKAPAVLKNVGAITVCVGAFLFVLFLVFMLRSNESATVGHLCVALALAGVGLFIWLWATRWAVEVDGEQIEIHKLIRKYRSSFQRIQRAKIDKKGEIVLYGEDGKRLVTVDSLSDNYDLFVASLNARGLLQ